MVGIFVFQFLSCRLLVSGKGLYHYCDRWGSYEENNSVFVGYNHGDGIGDGGNTFQYRTGHRAL